MRARRAAEWVFAKTWLYLVALLVLLALASYIAFAYVAQVQADADWAAIERAFARPEKFLRASARGHANPAIPTERDSLENLFDIEYGGMADTLEDFETHAGPPPSVDVCLHGECAGPDTRVRFALAYPFHLDRGGGVDSWDLVFAPTENGFFTKDPARVVLRENPSNGGGPGFLFHRRSASLGLFPSRGIALLIDFHKSEAGEVAKSYSTEERMGLANRICAPYDSLVLRSELSERAASRPPLASEIRDLVESSFAEEFAHYWRENWPAGVPAGLIFITGSLAALIAGIALLFFRRSLRTETEPSEPESS